VAEGRRPISSKRLKGIGKGRLRRVYWSEEKNKEGGGKYIDPLVTETKEPHEKPSRSYHGPIAIQRGEGMPFYLGNQKTAQRHSTTVFNRRGGKRNQRDDG